MDFSSISKLFRFFVLQSRTSEQMQFCFKWQIIVQPGHTNLLII